MTRVITYGTYDLLHAGHINLLKRAKALGDYLIVGVTSEDYDITRGKLSVSQSLSERIEAVRQTGIADEIIVEEYDGQKIEDIQRYNVDIFTVGSDWVGKFDYLNEYCNVVYLPRTEGVSSTEIRIHNHNIAIGVVGYTNLADKFVRECDSINGIYVKHIYSPKNIVGSVSEKVADLLVDSYDLLLEQVEAVYVIMPPNERYAYSKKALLQGKHVLCESPIALERAKAQELFDIAQEKKCILMEAIRTAYSIAFNRMCLMVHSGKIGQVRSVETTCTSLAEPKYLNDAYGSLYNWGATAMLPVFKLLGTQDYSVQFTSAIDEKTGKDYFTDAHFCFDKAIANIKVGNGVKSEGDMVVSGTKGYVYIPAPWWKTDYFEIRRENPQDNTRIFFSLPGEGIRYEIAAFAKAVFSGHPSWKIDRSITLEISSVMELFGKGEALTRLN